MNMIRVCLAIVCLLAATPASAGFQSLDQQPTSLNPPPGLPGEPTPMNPTPTPQQAPGARRPSEPPQGQAPRAAAEVPQRRVGLRGKDVNLLIELTITDQTGSAPAEKKTVSMLVADQSMGRIRAASDARQVSGFISTGLNVDARPVLLEGSTDRILLEMTIEYAPVRPTDPESKGQGRPTQLHESINVILTSGKPLLVSQAADPATDRKMTVEVKASIVK